MYFWGEKKELLLAIVVDFYYAYFFAPVVFPFWYSIQSEAITIIDRNGILYRVTNIT